MIRSRIVKRCLFFYLKAWVYMFFLVVCGEISAIIKIIRYASTELLMVYCFFICLKKSIVAAMEMIMVYPKTQNK